MSNTFLSRFNLESGRVFVFFGDKFKNLLVQQLAHESVKSGFYSLILSVNPSTYPVEGKVLVSDDLSILSELIKKDNPREIYIAQKVKDDLLYPFGCLDINRFVKQIDEKFKLFLSMDEVSDKDIGHLKFIKKATLICYVNLNLLLESFPEISRLKEQSRKSLSDQVTEKVLATIKKNCPRFKEFETAAEKICFIGQVKGFFDENAILPVARGLKSLLNSKILIGNIHTYQIKEI